MENYQNKCFISSVVKALSIKKKLKLYNLEKECAGNQNLNDNRCLCPKYSKYCSSGFRTKHLEYERNGFLQRFFIEDSMENFVVKSAFGFIGGILLTYICFMFLVFSLNFTLKRATYICMGLGIILSLGLAFSVKIRCTVFLCIPQLFSKRGRQALLAYAFILALSGPAKNTLHNVEVMSESLACGQEQLKQAENEVLKCVQKPNAAAKKSIEKLLEKINSAVKYFKNFIFQLYRNCFDILETVLHAQKWLYSISFLCHKKIGRPTQRCLNVLSGASENCQGIKDSEEWKRLCEIHPSLREHVCFTEQKSVCFKHDVIRSFPILKLRKQLMSFKERATNIYSVKLEAHQTYSQYNRTNIYHEEYQGMATEIRQKTDQFLQYFDFMSVIFGIFILVLFVKVIIYRHKFLTEDHYDNRFITSDFVDIDDARAEFKMETLLPLTPREKMKYIKVTSFRLVPCEKVRLLSSFVFLIFATFKIIIHMMTDSSLYWILSSVRQDERLLYMNTIKVDHPTTSVTVFGSGLTASLIRNVTRAVKEHSTVTPLDPTPCLPDPVPPDWNRYYQILALVLICWLLALCEPYGLRLRHSVMVTYHPDRARERAIWLYNRIMSNRTCFVKVARKELRKRYKDNPSDIFCSFQFLTMKPSFKCLLCNVKLTSTGKFFKCDSPNCAGVYCCPCFGSLKFCSICTDVGDYMDYSDLSEERDSSDEDICRCSKPKPMKPIKITIPSSRMPTSLSLNLKKIQLSMKDESKKSVSDSQKNSSITIPTKFEMDSAPEIDVKKKLLTSPVLVTPKQTSDISVQTVPQEQLPEYKISEPKRVRTLSEVESSDWEAPDILSQGSSAASETQPDTKKLPDATKEDPPGQGVKEPKKVESVKSVLKKSHLKKDRDGEMAIRLFRKVSLPENESDASKEKRKRLRWKTPPSDSMSDEDSKPNFRFRRRLKSLSSSSESLLTSRPMARTSLMDIRKDDNEDEDNSPDADSDEETRKTIFAGFWVIHNQSQYDGFKSISYGLARSTTGVSAHPETPTLPDPATPGTSNPNGSVRSSASTQHSKVFPFIDPFSICQFNAPCANIESLEMKEDEVEGNEEEVTTALMLLQPHRNRPELCNKKCSSSESSASSSPEVCLKKNISTSSGVGDGQFYSQPYSSCETMSESTNVTGNLKRTKGQLNLNIDTTNTFAKLYSVETDSSNDNFLSVKPNRRCRGKLDWGRKPGRLRVKNRSEGKPSPVPLSPSSSWDGQVWEVESHELVRKPCRARSEGNDGHRKKKTNQLSWAPDLLSDLPSSKHNLSESSSD